MQYQKDEVRNSILKAAIKEFKKNGFYRARMHQISMKSKVPIGNLYKYFPGKASLFTAIVEKADQEIKRVIEYHIKRYETEANTIEQNAQIEVIAYHAVKLINEYRTELILLADSSFGSPYEGYIDKIIIQVKDILKHKQLAGLAENDLMAQVIAKSLIEGLLIMLKSCPSDQLFIQISNLMLYFFSQGNFEPKLDCVMPKQTDYDIFLDSAFDKTSK